jgi:transposase
MTTETTEAPTSDPSVGAITDRPQDWHQINWRQAERTVRRLQIRIAQATQAGKWNRVKALQRLLTHSFSGKALAVRRVSVDGQYEWPFPKINELACCSSRRCMIECGQWICLTRPRSFLPMDPKEMALLSSVLHLPAGITMTSAHTSATELIIRVGCHLPTMQCPVCAQPSARIHGRYQRTVCDLPCAGRTVILLLTVCRFVCTTPTCSRAIFTERLPALVESYARKTSRLLVHLQVLGLATGGRLGARVAERFGIPASPSTMLRLVMRLPPPPARAVRVLGIDDFAWKKRFRYGTVLVDLESRTIIDILPDRESATVEKWLEKHPEVEIISRDRGKEFRKAATRAAPHAQQVVDRFHLARNLTEALQVILGHCRAEIRQAEEPVPEKAPHPLPAPEIWQQRTPARVEKAHQARQASRDDRYQQITELRSQGLTQLEIAQRVQMSERAVRTWLKQGHAPSWKRRSRRRSVFDPSAAYVLKRWQEGERSVKQLYEEIRAQGFPGTVRIVGRFLQALRDDPERLPLPPSTGADHFSSKTAAFLFIRDPKRLTSEQKADLELICQRSETACQTYELTQQFLSMLRERRGQDFEQWVQAVEASQLVELRRFARSLCQEKEAVKAGLILAVSNGPVEAQVQKLKVVKRAMYGTAKPPLLRQRLLHAI